MSSVRRIASGASASMTGMIANILTQIATVPIILSHWDQTTYGVWLAIQGVVTVMTIIDVGHQDFVGYECLRMPVEDRVWRSRILFSAFPFALFTGVALLLAFAGLQATGLITWLLGDASPGLAGAAGTALLIYAASWLVSQCFTGFLGRVLSSVGEAPRSAWFTLALNLSIWLAQIGGVIAGYGIVGVAMLQAAATIGFSILTYLHFFSLLRRHGIVPVRPDLHLGARNLTRSLGLTVGTLIETLQQGGFRVVLVPLVGPLALAQFATLRTIANTAQQGVNTFVNPTVPELMRVAAARHAAGTVAILSLLWFMAVMLIAPGVVLLQLVAPMIYQEWTRGRIAWDGMTFALLSAGIVINGFGQPGRAILRGNNLLRDQFAVSAVAGAVLLGGAWLLIPRLGLFGAASALVGAEAVRTALNIRWSGRWLRGAGIDPPTRMMAITAGVALACTLAVVAIARWPGLYLPAAAAFLACWLGGLAAFWHGLPADVRGRLTPLLRRFGPHLRLPARSGGMAEP